MSATIAPESTIVSLRNFAESRPKLDLTPLRHAVLLAGGRGTRLAPFTSVLPKPLMPIGERSILEIILDQLAGCGFSRITLSVGYLAHLIRAVLEQRPDQRIQVEYVHEDQPLGTAAPLRTIADLDETFLAMNGDVLTTIDYGDLVAHHRRAGNVITIASHERTVKIDYGVLHLGLDGDDARLRAYEEKPQITACISMGIYVIEPEALRHLPPSGSFDMPDLVKALLVAGKRVGTYRHTGMWFDIGRQDDYAAAASAWHNGIGLHMGEDAMSEVGVPTAQAAEQPA